jgi:putative cell wall-binding protein
MNKKKLSVIFILFITITVTTYAFNSDKVKADTTTQVTGTQSTGPITKKIPGIDGYDTSIAVSKDGWDKSDSVIIASGEDFPDALCGSSLAVQLNAPIFFTWQLPNLDKYDASTASDMREIYGEIKNRNESEINRLGAKKVYILGGQGAVSTDVEDGVKTPGVDVIRLQGADRFQTSVAIGQEIINKSKSTTAFLCNADGFADALSGATYAGRQGSPILLTEKDSLNSTTKNALVNWGIKDVFVLGGVGVISTNVEQELRDMGISVIRIGGVDRYDTSKKINEYFNKDLNKFTLVTGKDYHDALVASPYANKVNYPVILMDMDCSVDTKNFVKDKDFIIVGNDIDEDAIRNPVPISYYEKDGMTFSTLNDMPVLTENDVKNDAVGMPRYQYFKNHQEDWICPQIKSSATDNNVADFKTLGTELGMNYDSKHSSYSVYNNPSISQFAVADSEGYISSDVMFIFYVWSGDRSNPLNYRIQPMAKQVFKFYFGSASDDMFNKVNTIYKGSDAEYEALINQKFTIGDREVYFQTVDNTLQIFISKAGGKLNK